MIDFNEYPPGGCRVSCPACGRSPKDKTMGVTVAGEGHGVAHCFRCGHVETRRNDREQTPAERVAFKRRMDALRRQHDVEQRERQAETAEAAARRWAAAYPVTEHTYLTNKGVQAHSIRIEGGHTLLVPMRDAEGRLWSLQSIAPDGEKRFMPGGRVKGCYYAIGKPSGRVVVAEGFATGATIHEDTGLAVAVAFNAGNLLPVAKAVRAKLPCITLVVAADDDWKTEGNPGLAAAKEAAQAVGGLLAVPDFSGLTRRDTDTDFNDLHRLAGTVEVQA